MKNGWFTVYLALLPFIVLVSGSAFADDMISTYRLATEQDQQYRAAINIYEAESAALGKARAGLLPLPSSGCLTSGSRGPSAGPTGEVMRWE